MCVYYLGCVFGCVMYDIGGLKQMITWTLVMLQITSNCRETYSGMHTPWLKQTLGLSSWALSKSGLVGCVTAPERDNHGNGRFGFAGVEFKIRRYWCLGAEDTWNAAHRIRIRLARQTKEGAEARMSPGSRRWHLLPRHDKGAGSRRLERRRCRPCC